MPNQINPNLTAEQKKVLLEKGTEAPFSGEFYLKTSDGTFYCANCNNPLFKTNEQFDSHCGWPSFTDPISKDAVKYVEDNTLGMNRTEVLCGKCEAHLGHVFDDGPGKSGQRYCINSVALEKR